MVNYGVSYVPIEKWRGQQEKKRARLVLRSGDKEIHETTSPKIRYAISPIAALGLYNSNGANVNADMPIVTLTIINGSIDEPIFCLTERDLKEFGLFPDKNKKNRFATPSRKEGSRLTLGEMVSGLKTTEGVIFSFRNRKRVSPIELGRIEIDKRYDSNQWPTDMDRIYEITQQYWTSQ